MVSSDDETEAGTSQATDAVIFFTNTYKRHTPTYTSASRKKLTRNQQQKKKDYNEEMQWKCRERMSHNKNG